jgi:glycosyltransferase involved in cell wall biosynthesis
MAPKLHHAEFGVAPARRLHDDGRRAFPDLKRSKILLAPNTVNTRRWTPAEPRRGRSSFCLVTIGRLPYGKGDDVLLNAIARLRRGAASA